MQFAEDILPEKFRAYCEKRKDDLTKNIYYFVVPTENTDVNQEYYVRLELFSHLQMRFKFLLQLSYFIQSLRYEVQFQTIMMVVSYNGSTTKVFSTFFKFSQGFLKMTCC